MKNRIFILLIALVSIVSCNDDTGGESLATFPRLKISSTSNVDFFDLEKLKIWSFQDSIEVEGEIEVVTSEKGVDYSELDFGVNLFFPGSKFHEGSGTHIFYLQLKDDDIDTVAWEVSGTPDHGSSTIGVFYNEKQLFIQGLVNYYTVTKE